MSSPGYSENKRFSIPTTPIQIIQANAEQRSRSNSVARRNSIDTSAAEFANNCEKLADKHKTSKIQVILESVIKVLEVLKN